VSIDYYSLGQMVCSEGGRELYRLLAEKRAVQLHNLLSSDTPAESLALFRQTVLTIDWLTGQLDKGLIAFCKASNSKLPEWKKDLIKTPRGGSNEQSI
jgi:hypothetical protein